MKTIPYAGSDGFWIEDKVTNDNQYFGVRPYPVSSEENAEIGYVVGVPIKPGIYKPRLNIPELEKRFGKDAAKWPESFQESDASWLWIEGLSDSEIEEIKHGSVAQPTDDMETRINAKITEVWDFILNS